ncbi:MAG: asparagine synthase C-terminal domain-containing protein, partial [Acidobacteriota bacterium]|nr:asparagine synthase C-terminal domain-containing protein [Acidobacteriota bacterium]
IAPPSPLSITRREAIAVYAELFEKAVAKTLPAGDLAVPLSGGRDSRHIALALSAIGHQPAACVTALYQPPRSNEDARVAAEICAAADINHLLVEQSDTRFSSEILKNLKTGFCTLEHGWFVGLAKYIEKQWTAVYDGIAGDVLSAGHFLDAARLDLFRRGKFEELADLILLSEGYLPALLTVENYRKFSREKAVSRVVEELSRCAAALNPVGSFYLRTRTRRCIALSPFRLFGEGMQIITPFLEADLFDFLVSLPVEMFLDQKFHTETIAFAYPQYAAVGYEKSETGEILAHKEFQQYSRDMLKLNLTARKHELINRKFVIARCLRGMFDKSYSRNVIDFGMIAILLMQLERL